MRSTTAEPPVVTLREGRTRPQHAWGGGWTLLGLHVRPLNPHELVSFARELAQS